MNIYSLKELRNAERTYLPTKTYYSEDYAQEHCRLYLSDEVYQDEDGHMKKFYRLHAKEPHTIEMALAYDIKCPACKKSLKQVGRQITTTKLGLYTCPSCNKER